MMMNKKSLKKEIKFLKKENKRLEAQLKKKSVFHLLTDWLRT